MIRLIFIYSVSLLLGGCLSQGTQSVSRSVNQLIQSNQEIVYDSTKMRSTGAGVLRASFAGRASVYMGLHSLNAQTFDLLFVSNDGVGIELYNGQIRSTTKLQADIRSVVPLSGDPFFDGFKELHPSKTFFWKIHSDSGYGLIANSRYRLVGSDEIETAYGAWELSHWIESWSIKQLDYHTENHYWVDQDGIVVKSTQKPLPDNELMNFLLYSYKPVKMQ
jgi:hypothetical protein